MNHRDRVLTALSGEKPDRCPMQISFTPEFADRLRENMKIGGDGHNPHGGGNTYILERALERSPGNPYVLGELIALVSHDGWSCSSHPVGHSTA